ncbi:MATE family efflux transporter [Cuneatibacter sp. NSJ-177]|uniref:MATE family efflux transporter n=1 Tax=Cuneatibacter sp. NSJ-177 TaxID=2931401 RepID=UPI001FD58A53|nr:MATE family efflux transporter [Cuneatibacter sp. NSJ-177]MCJ7833976.1 MATE family efflux transporter [Cuneatibacter sp. NSJ-177]
MKKDMTVGQEWKTVLVFSLPMMGASLLQVLYNFVDSVIVGNFVSATALGAIGLTSSMTWLLVTFCTGLGSGTSIAVSQYFGAKKEKEIREVIASVFLVAIGLSLAITLACFLIAKPLIFGFLQTPEEMRGDSLTYYLIYSSGIIFQLLYNVTYGILRAHGDSKGALIFLLISSILNVALDCLFVIVFHWGVAGAAVATVIAQAGSAIASLIYLYKLYPDLVPSRKYLYAWKPRALLISRLSVPIIFQSMISALGFIVLQRLVNSFGSASIEGYAAMQRIEQIAHIPANSFNVAIASFIGQNIGAKKLERVKNGYRATVRMGVLISVMIAALVILLDQNLLGMFNIAGESMRRGKEHLDLLMLFIWVSTISNITCGFLQGAGDVKIPAASGFVNLGVRLALSYLLAGTAVSFRCIYVSMPPAWIIACLLVVFRYRSGKWKNYRIT